MAHKIKEVLLGLVLRVTRVIGIPFLVSLAVKQDLEIALLAQNLAIGGPNVHRFLVLVRNLQQVTID